MTKGNFLIHSVTSGKRQIAVHLLILTLLAILTITLFFRFSTEDSYITYRYAENLAKGKGFVYNEGEKVLGTSAPFYAFILAFFGLLGFSIPHVGGILSAFSLGASLILVYLLSLKKGYPLIGFIFGLFVLMNPWFLYTFGSETFFQLLMIISAFYFYDQKKYIPTVIFCALAFLVRADGIIPAIIIFAHYVITQKKFPAKGVVFFMVICFPVFLYCYLSFDTLFPSTLGVKQAQYASSLWRHFIPGTFYFAGFLLKENFLLHAFIPLLIIGGFSLLFSHRIWLLISLWAILHTIGYALLKVSFYHWYLIPLIFLLMLMSAFSLHFVISLSRFFKNNQTKQWRHQVFTHQIKISISRVKEPGPFLRKTHQILSFVIIVLIVIALSGGIKSYLHTRRFLPFPKLQLYTKAGKWAAENTPPDAEIAFLEVGYFGYYAQRKIIDLVGLVTPGVSDHIRERDFSWAVKKYRPDYLVYNPEFEGWLKIILDQPWFEENYIEIKEIDQEGYPFRLTAFKKIRDFQPQYTLVVDSAQEQSTSPVGELVGGMEIGQTFYCHHNNLARIKVMLATYNRENHQYVIFHLKKSPSDDVDIYTEKFKASTVIDNAYRLFDFPPVSDSKGKMFFFSFESPRSKSEDAITIWSSNPDNYNKGSLYINGKEAEGDLRFITYFFEK